MNHDERTPVGGKEDSGLPLIMTDERLIATVMRQVIADALDKPLAGLNEKMGAIVQGLKDLQARMVDLESRQTTIERREHSPHPVAWAALALSLIDSGVVLALLLK